MNTYQKRMRWLAKHGFTVKRAGLNWVAKLNGHVVNFNRNKHEVVRDTFREFGLGVSC